LKAISSSVEGITSESEDEIKNLSIGTSMITGITDMPLFVNVRPRMTSHGGHAVNIIEAQDDSDFFQKSDGFESQELLPLIRPKASLTDVEIMNPGSSVKAVLIPSYLFLCKEKDKDFALLVEMENGEVVVDVENYVTKKLPRLSELTGEEIKVLKFSYTKTKFKEEDAVKKIGLDATEILGSLVKKGLILKKDNIYNLNDGFIFSQLSKNACYSKVEPESIPYSEKREKKIRLDSMKAELSKFVEVKDQQECFTVKYVVEKGAKKKKAKAPAEQKTEEKKAESVKGEEKQKEADLKS